MATDLYRPCPCGSGKKLKFCCRDIVHELERLERMISGDQHNAALEKIAKLLEQYPHRPALLAQRVRAYLRAGDLESSKSAMQELLERDPDNAVGNAINAMILAREGKLEGAVRALHRCFAVVETSITQEIYDAMFAVALLMYRSKHLFAAHAYLSAIVSISQMKDERALSAFVELERSKNLPVVLKSISALPDAPTKVTWRREYQTAFDASRALDWITAAEILDGMAKRILDEPVILRALATLQGRLARNQAAAKAWRMYGRIRGIPWEDALDAELRAQLLSEEIVDAAMLDVVAVFHEIDAVDPVMERLLTSKQAVNLTHRSVRSDGPPPRGVFAIGDRAIPFDQPDPEFGQVSCLVGHVTVYGKETDRAARIVVVLGKDENFESALAAISGVVGETIRADDPCEIVSRIPKVSHLFRSKLLLPHTVDTKVRDRLAQESLDNAILVQWPKTELIELGGRTPEEAAADPKLRIPLAAAVEKLAVALSEHLVDRHLDNLRQRFNLPPRLPIEAAELAEVRGVPRHRYLQLVPENLTDEALEYVFHVVTSYGWPKATERFGVEILNRPQMNELVPFVDIHEAIADTTDDVEIAQQHLVKARQLSVAAGESPARWLIAELELQLASRNGEQALRLVNEIQARHINEPGVAQQLHDVLNQFGLLRSDKTATSPLAETVEVGAVAAQPGNPEIWTPGSAAEATASPDKPSGLWIPGMD